MASAGMLQSPGAGRSALAPPRGLFASGKFDQYKRDIPYASLAQALLALIRPLLGKNEAELEFLAHRAYRSAWPGRSTFFDCWRP